MFFLGEGLCVRCSCLYYLASLHLCHFPIIQSPCFIQSSSPRSPRSPCSPRDTCKVSRSFSSRPESQGGQANQELSEKVLLNLEEVKVSRRRRNIHCFIASCQGGIRCSESSKFVLCSWVLIYVGYSLVVTQIKGMLKLSACMCVCLCLWALTLMTVCKDAYVNADLL